MTTLYLDCFSGASGDMVLGALIDAGVPLAEVRRALGSLALDPDAVWTERVVRTGISATRFQVRGERVPASGPAPGQAGVHTHAPGQSHAHGTVAAAADVAVDHGHRTLDEIYRLIDGSALRPETRDRAKTLFARLGQVEAEIHGIPVEAVHLHEVGALDSIVDIVGAVHAVDALGVDEVVASPLNVGSGTVRTAHGLYPVPAPATLKLLGGVPVYAGPQVAEMVTPTGALLVTGFATRYGPMPAMTVTATGYGAGAREFDDAPNVLRAVLGTRGGGGHAHTVSVVECEIDDLNPQILGALMGQLLAAGALDVFYTAVQMKKNRPGTLVTLIAPPDRREALTAMLFRETTTIGVRHREMARECLTREHRTVETPLGAVRFKVASRDGVVLNAAPEFDDVQAIAAAHGRPLKDVQALAMKAFLDS
ncbi:MAG: nickel pincer cofactor biosynthesis protein LarC [Vicinamibacterales bacterium]